MFCSIAWRLRRRLTGICLVSFLFAFCSCQDLIRPKSFPATQVASALVTTPSPVYRGGEDLITIVSIDGQPPTFMENKAIVSPGVHVFQVRVEIYHDSSRNQDRRFVTRADTSIKVEIKARKVYLIDAKEDARGLWVWVKDTDTDEVVAGEMPPQN